METDEWSVRQVKDGDILSGMGGPEKWPEILILDGVGHGGGSALCCITCFKVCAVRVADNRTRLTFGGIGSESRTLTITGGVVQYFGTNRQVDSFGPRERSRANVARLAAGIDVREAAISGGRSA